jgi:hypothetical protein
VEFGLGISQKALANKDALILVIYSSKPPQQGAFFFNHFMWFTYFSNTT